MKILKSKEKKDKGKGGEILKIVLIVVIILAVIFVILWQTGYWDVFKTAYQTQKQKAADEKVLNELKEIMELPDDIMPIMAVINDPDLLREQQPEFFKNAKAGDRLIIYPDKAIIYNAKEGKIRNVGPVNFGQGAIGTVPFAIYNGSGDETKLAEFEEKLKNTFNNAEVKVKENAAGQYDQTLVIDLKGDNPEIQKIADSLGAQVGELPEGEKKPEGAAVLVIVGKE